MTKIEREYQQYLAEYSEAIYGPLMDFDTFCCKQEQPYESTDDCFMSYSPEEVI